MIIGLTVVVTLLSTAISSLIGVPFGVVIGSSKFRGKKSVIRLVYTFAGIPPVIAGLLVYVFLSRKGPLGSLGLLFTPTAMVIAQVIIVTPLITGLTTASVKLKWDLMSETCTGLGLGRMKSLALLLYESRYPIISAVMTGYGRSMSEVGAVMLVGGNIQYSTRVMTTAILLETGEGNYDRALAMGIILLSISFLVNLILQRFQGET